MSARQNKMDAKLWGLIALVIGYNELAKKAKTLGEKVFFRVARDLAEGEAVSLGVGPILEPQAYILEIEVPRAMMCVRFRAQDIELMRDVVKEHDARVQVSK